MTYEIKAQNAPGILDNGVKLFRNNVKALFVISLAAFVPLEVIKGLMLAANMENVGGFRLGMSPEEMTAWLQRVQAANTPLLKVITWFGILIVNPFTIAGLTYLIAMQYLNKSATAIESIGAASKKFVSLIWAHIILFVAFFGVCIVGGILIGICAVTIRILIFIPIVLIAIGGCYVFLRYSLITSVVMLEDKRGTKALERSAELMSGNYGVLIVLGLIILVMKLVIMMFGAINTFISVIIIRVIINSCLDAALLSFSTCAFVVFYYSCRCKRENFDLGLMAESVTTPQSPIVPTAGEATPLG